MVDLNKNRLVYKKQLQTMGVFILVVSIVLALVIVFMSQGKAKQGASKQTVDLIGVVDESFTEANTESAMTAQQSELEDLKVSLDKMFKKIESMNDAKSKEVSLLEKKLQNVTKEINDLKSVKKEKSIDVAEIQNPKLWHHNEPQANYRPAVYEQQPRAKMKVVSFDGYYKSKAVKKRRYVPSNTSVRAVLLGGADADASVNGQSNNNGVMLFKFLDNGTMPNGARSYLQGCRVSASSYGDISSERAYATLYKLSCAKKGESIIDKPVTGWVFFGGKVGIKGVPLMRDGKVVTWAGVSGGLSGVAQAAQAAQSIQNFTPFGATSVLPSDRVAGFAGLGGASKAAEQLSNYYIKRAEQYHPVIQVGAGNVATIVFKDGFYLESEEENERPNLKSRAISAEHYTKANQDSNEHFDSENYSVPPEVLSHIEKIQNNRLSKKED